MAENDHEITEEGKTYIRVFGTLYDSMQRCIEDGIKPSMPRDSVVDVMSEAFGKDGVENALQSMLLDRCIVIDKAGWIQLTLRGTMLGKQISDTRKAYAASLN